MNEEQQRFLSLIGQFPARLTVEDTAWVLNCRAHDVPILVAAKLLRPLGSPSPNGVKFFATADIMELLKDRPWLARMTNAITQHWHKKNERKKPRTIDGIGTERLAA